MNNCTPWLNRSVWLLGVIAFGSVFSVRAANDEATTATKTGGITIYSNKRGTDGADIKTGPITTSTSSSGPQDETVTTAIRMGNVTELTGSKGTKSTVVTTGPVTSGKVNGKTISITRIGENVALGTDESGGAIKAIQVGNQVVVQRSENVSPAEMRIAVQLLQEPAIGKVSGCETNDVALLPFTGVDASGDVLVEVESGQAFGIVVADEKTREYTTFAVADGALSVGCIGAGSGERFSRRVVVKLPNLTEVTAKDGARLVVRNVMGERCLVVSRGGGKVDISGKADTVQCRVSSGGKVLGQDLHAGRMSVRLDGDGEVHCRADQELVVMIAGKGTVWSHGRPGLVTRKITGGGELRFEE